MRRMFPPGPLDINTPLPAFDPARGKSMRLFPLPTGNGWQRIPKQTQVNGGVLIDGEDQLPLFAMNFAEDDGRKRRVVAGLVPVGKREAYMGAGMKKQAGDPQPVVEPQPLSDPRMILFWSQVTEPWKKLLEQAADGGKMNRDRRFLTIRTLPPQHDKSERRHTAVTAQISREQIQTGSWYVLLDFATCLRNKHRACGGYSTVCDHCQVSPRSMPRKMHSSPRSLIRLFLTNPEG